MISAPPHLPIPIPLGHSRHLREAGKQEALPQQSRGDDGREVPEQTCGDIGVSTLPKK